MPSLFCLRGCLRLSRIVCGDFVFLVSCLLDYVGAVLMFVMLFCYRVGSGCWLFASSHVSKCFLGLATSCGELFLRAVVERARLSSFLFLSGYLFGFGFLFSCLSFHFLT